MELYIQSPSTPSWRGAQLKNSTGTFFVTNVRKLGVQTPKDRLFTSNPVRV
jgi:hypothetical protein